jgi:hypothetical protein
LTSTTISRATRSGADAARAVADRAWRLDSRAQAAVAVCLYLVFALAITWPWITDPNGILYGVEGGDQTASVAQFQHNADSLQPPFLPGRLEDVDAPEGLETTWALSLAAFGSSVTLFTLSVAFGSVAAHGLMSVLGFTATAFAMFLLLRRITGHFGTSLVIGLAFGFSPYTYPTGWTWPAYIHLWVFVLLFWRMLVLSERPTVRNGLLAGGATAVAMTWIQYNLLIAGVLYATMMAVALVRAWSTKTLRSHIRAQFAGAAVVCVVMLTVLVAATAADFRGLPARAATDAVTGSARPLMYLLPGPNHPLFGDSIGDWLLRKYAGPTYDAQSTAQYATIYLGIPLMLLAIVGLVLVARQLRNRGSPALQDDVVWAAGFAVAAGFVALVFSAPPHVELLGFSVPMPYSLVNEVTTAFRTAHRFAIVVMLAVAILAAIGAANLPRGRRVGVQVAAVAALAVVLTLDLWAVPEARVTRVTSPAVYELLKRQPDGIVAEYPYRDIGWIGAVESYQQHIHGHPLFKGFDQGTETESRKLDLQYLLEPRTVPDLARYGVRYVIVHEARAARPNYIPRPGTRIPGLRYIGGDRERAALYRVTASPSRFTTYAGLGFNAPEGDPPATVRWLRDNGAKLHILGSCDPCSGTLSFESASFARPRELTLRDQRGRVIYRHTIGAEAVSVHIPLRFSDVTDLSFSTNPAPEQINLAIGGEDTRSFGVSVGKVRFTPG